MTQPTTEGKEPKTDNELIAEFMGVRETQGSFDSYGHDCPCWYTTNGLGRSVTFTVPGKSFIDFVYESKYHSSWDWLMPVVEKINSIDKSSVTIYPDQCLISVDGTCVSGAYNGSTKECVYTSVINFIKWYNSKNIQP